MNEAKLYELIRAPKVSEKTANLQALHNRYTFEVARDATKPDIKQAVETLFEVKVKSVNVLNVKGKSKSFRQRQGARGNWRKAYVTLVEGQSIEAADAATA